MITSANTLKVSFAVLAATLLTAAVPVRAQSVNPISKSSLVPILSPRPVMQLARPDLIIESFRIGLGSFRSGLGIGRKVVFFRVKNQGTASAPQSVCQVMIEHTQSLSSVPALEPGQSVEIETSITSPMTGALYIAADYYNPIFELNELNNELNDNIALSDWSK